MDEYEYEEMVDDEIKDLRRKLDPALKSFSSKIKRIYVDAGEKSWVEISVTLK